jgi:hypothetical protein
MRPLPSPISFILSLQLGGRVLVTRGDFLRFTKPRHCIRQDPGYESFGFGVRQPLQSGSRLYTMAPRQCGWNGGLQLPSDK